MKFKGNIQMGKGGWNASWNADYLHIANGRIEEITWEIEGRILDLKHQTRMLRTNQIRRGIECWLTSEAYYRPDDKS